MTLKMLSMVLNMSTAVNVLSFLASLASSCYSALFTTFKKVSACLKS